MKYMKITLKGGNIQMENKKMLSVFALGLIALLSVSFVMAYQGDYSLKGPNYSEDRHEAMENAFDNLDYDAWVELMTQDGRHPGIIDKVTEDNFETFSQIYEAKKTGDFEKAQQLREELGFGKKMNGKGMGGFGKQNAYGNFPHAN